MEKQDPPPYSQVTYGSSPSYGQAYVSSQPTAPLLQPTTTVIVTESKGGSSSVCGCAVGVFICIFVCCCCVISAAILGGVFGYWGVQCANRENYGQRVYNHNLIGLDTKTIEIKTPGTINFISTPSVVLNTLSVRMNISAGQLSSSDALDVEVEMDNNQFIIDVYNNWWYCPLVDVDAVLSETLISGTIDLKLHSYNSPINVASSIVLAYESADIYTLLGDIQVTNVLSIDYVGVKTLNGDVDVKNIAGASLDFESSNGDVDLEAIVGEEIDIKTMNGDIYGNNITLVFFDSNDCKMNVYTALGEIELDVVNFPILTECDVEIISRNGPISVTVRSFSGFYELNPYNGRAFVNGVQYSGIARGYVQGAQDHNLYIKSSNGDLTLNINNSK